MTAPRFARPEHLISRVDLIGKVDLIEKLGKVDLISEVDLLGDLGRGDLISKVDLIGDLGRVDLISKGDLGTKAVLVARWAWSGWGCRPPKRASAQSLKFKVFQAMSGNLNMYIYIYTYIYIYIHTSVRSFALQRQS